MDETKSAIHYLKNWKNATVFYSTFSFFSFDNISRLYYHNMVVAFKINGAQLIKHLINQIIKDT